MKVFGKVIAILTALAAVAGVIYVIAAYGDKIVAWAKGLVRRNKDIYNFDEFDDEFDYDAMEEASEAEG